MLLHDRHENRPLVEVDLDVVGRLDAGGIDADADVRLVGYPGSSLMDLLRPKPSSLPAAVSLPEAVGVLVGRSVAGLLSQAERSLSGATALWLGESRF